MSALITSYSADNRVVESALSVSYFKRLIQGTWQGKTLVGGVVTATYYLMHEYHRVARKTYKYVGMTEAAAKSCAAAMIALYTRTVKFQQWSETTGENGQQGTWVTSSSRATEMSADIAARHVAGDMWETVVNVNEDSVYLSRTDISRLYETIFADERLRSYDGETETT